MSTSTPFGPHSSPTPAAACETPFLILPHATPPGAQPPPATQILVVDGDPLTCAALGAWLNRRGHAVALACSHFTARDMWRDATFDLVLYDVDAPPRTPRPWLEKFLRSVTCPVVLIAAETAGAPAVNGAHPPLAGRLSKPVDLAALAQLLAQIFPPAKSRV